MQNDDQTPGDGRRYDSKSSRPMKTVKGNRRRFMRSYIFPPIDFTVRIHDLSQSTLDTITTHLPSQLQSTCITTAMYKTLLQKS
eukprot:6179243-Pleurochrysis_carterae.AAC.3